MRNPVSTSRRILLERLVAQRWNLSRGGIRSFRERRSRCQQRRPPPPCPWSYCRTIRCFVCHSVQVPNGVYAWSLSAFLATARFDRRASVREGCTSCRRVHTTLSAHKTGKGAQPHSRSGGDPAGKCSVRKSARHQAARGIQDPCCRVSYMVRCRTARHRRCGRCGF